MLLLARQQTTANKMWHEILVMCSRNTDVDTGSDSPRGSIKQIERYWPSRRRIAFPFVILLWEAVAAISTLSISQTYGVVHD